MSESSVKERPILMSGTMVRAILAGNKTQTRRVMKDQPIALYDLDSSVRQVYHRTYDDFSACATDADSRISELGLHGRGGWKDLLANAVQRLWEKGIRGLVCVSWSHNPKRLFDGFVVPRKCEGDEVYTPARMYGFSRDAKQSLTPGSPLGRQSFKQYSEKSGMGNPRRELAGQEGTQQACNQRGVQVDSRRKIASSLGSCEGSMQSEVCGEDSRHASILYIAAPKWEIGTRLWVRETFGVTARWPCSFQKQAIADGFWQSSGMAYRADAPDGNWDWRSSIHMPRWASRITLEITDVRVQRLQDISGYDCLDEGIPPQGGNSSDGEWRLQRAYSKMWDSINGAGAWDKNPWVWCVSFKRVDDSAGATARG